MSARTLTDELRSVLLFHALEAPEPNATVDRILNDTVGAATVLGGDPPPSVQPVAARGGRRVSTQQLVAASVVALLLLAVAGINSFRTRNDVTDAERSRQPGGRGRRSARRRQRRQSPADGAMALPGTGSDQAGSQGRPAAGSRPTSARR